ncbi:MAG: YHYH domain-containing protein [Acidobacteria bacterium]|nr:YHYH domain-containing protein [Acidobacteriota bacterium]
MKPRSIAFSLLALSVLAASVLSHGGGLDSLGCHHDRKRGGYHCHRGDLAGRSFGSKADALKALSARQKPQENSREEDTEERTVYVTKTGKKFHGESCSYLSSSKIAMSLKDAKKKGYTACSRCKGRQEREGKTP